MSSSFGSSVKVQVFGQSHSTAIGVVVDGLPAGEAVDLEELASFMARRAPGKNAWSTPRKEADAPSVLSGLNPEGRTCGAPLAMVIENTNTRSSDYAQIARNPRPGHADLTAQARWHGQQDVADSRSPRHSRRCPHSLHRRHPGRAFRSCLLWLRPVRRPCGQGFPRARRRGGACHAGRHRRRPGRAGLGGRRYRMCLCRSPRRCGSPHV